MDECALRLVAVVDAISEDAPPAGRRCVCGKGGVASGRRACSSDDKGDVMTSMLRATPSIITEILALVKQLNATEVRGISDDAINALQARLGMVIPMELRMWLSARLTRTKRKKPSTSSCVRLATVHFPESVTHERQ